MKQMMRSMGKLMKRLLGIKDNEELAHQSESSDADSPLESIETGDQKPTDVSEEETYFACPHCMSSARFVVRKISPETPMKEPTSPKQTDPERDKGFRKTS